MMRSRIIIIFFSILTFSIKAQQAYYSSLNQNLLSINPAFAGTNDKLRVQAIIGNTGAPKYGYNNQSYYAGADFLAGKHNGFGLSFSTNVYGKALKQTQVDFSYALHSNITDKIKLVSAFQASYFQISVNRDYYNYAFPGQFIQSGGRDVVYQTKRNGDFSSGLLLYGKRFYAGASFLSLIQPDEGVLGVSKRPLTQIYQGKYRFGDFEKLNVDAYAFVKLQVIGKQAAYSNFENFVQYGVYLNYKMISLHIAHRINDPMQYDAFISGVALNFKNFKLGYNNRYNYETQLSGYFFNEFYLAYCFGKKNVEGEQNTSIKLIN